MIAIIQCDVNIHILLIQHGAERLRSGFQMTAHHSDNVLTDLQLCISTGILLHFLSCPSSKDLRTPYVVPPSSILSSEESHEVG